MCLHQQMYIFYCLTHLHASGDLPLRRLQTCHFHHWNDPAWQEREVKISVQVASQAAAIARQALEQSTGVV